MFNAFINTLNVMIKIYLNDKMKKKMRKKRSFYISEVSFFFGGGVLDDLILELAAELEFKNYLKILKF